jgi:CubicO group peptidase (beta-lactamase class C family)
MDRTTLIRTTIFLSLAAGGALDVPRLDAQNPPARAAIDSLFAAWDHPESPGCAVAVVQDGHTLLARGYGSANLDYQVPITPRTVFYLASVSKQFTAAAVALAAEQGYLSLDDDVRRWFPELPDYGATIRVRHLVHHTSGLRDYLGLMSLADMPYGNSWSDDEILDLIARQRGLNFSPGTEYLYSNSGYFLMAELVERATGRSLREYTTAEMFEPLGMRNTWFHDDASQVVRNRAVAYGPKSGGGYRMTHLFNFDKVGSGGLYSTVEDLALWDANFYQSRIGGDEFLATLHTPGELTAGDPLDYAFGLRMSEYRGLATVEHGGSMMGFRTNYLRFPGERTSVLTLCNLGTINPTALTRDVADLVLAERLAPVPEREEGAATIAVVRLDEDLVARPALPLTAYAGRYLSEELGVTFEVVVRADTLRLLQPGGADRTLTAMGGDEFRATGGWGVRFLRGDGGVSGFVLDAGRVRNLSFGRATGR